MRIRGSKMDEIREGSRMKSFVTYTPRQILLGSINQGIWVGTNVPCRGE
jgi:hypothetical protein